MVPAAPFTRFVVASTLLSVPAVPAFPQSNNDLLASLERTSATAAARYDPAGTSPREAQRPDNLIVVPGLSSVVDVLGRQPAAGASFAPAISGDGRRIAFTSTAPLDGPRVARAGAPILDRPRVAQVYLRDRVADVTRLVSAAPGGAANDGTAWKPSIDAGGRPVAFVSTATTLTREDRDGGADVFVADLVTGAIALISRSARGGGGSGPSAGPVLSADGRLVAFQSEASDLLCAGRCAGAEEDINLLPDVFLFDRRAAAMTRVSGDTSGGWLRRVLDDEPDVRRGLHDPARAYRSRR